jgi:hypothetical protein
MDDSARAMGIGTVQETGYRKTDAHGVNLKNKGMMRGQG